MSLEFSGAAVPLCADDFRHSAAEIGCEIAALRAVAYVESAGGGFLADGRPKILFERHVFDALTGGRYRSVAPDLSAPSRGGYGRPGAGQYARLRRAINLDRCAALKSASWGMFQLLGREHAMGGYAHVERMVADFATGESLHLQALLTFCRAKRIDEALRSRQWAKFARGYNGRRYADHDYDGRLARAYDFFAGLPDAGLANLAVVPGGPVPANLADKSGKSAKLPASVPPPAAPVA